jgi:hypothetical protein
MILLTPDLRAALRANDAARHAALQAEQPEPDPVPVLKLFNPMGQQHGSPPSFSTMKIPCSGWRIWALAALNWACSACRRLPVSACPMGFASSAI